MYRKRLLSITTAALAALGTLLLCMGPRNTPLALGMFAAAGISVWVTDIAGWFRLNRAVANVASILALLLSLRTLWSLSGSVQVLSVANLLAYLQIILLFQEKDVRLYWQLLMLSLLQVVVAAAYYHGVLFGVLLVVYMLLGMLALCLLFLERQWTRYGEVSNIRPGPWKRSPSPDSETSDRRWPLAIRRSEFFSAPAGRSAAGLGREIVLRLGLMGLGTLMLTAILFFTIPRLGHSAWRGALVAPKRVVGFNDRVILGELGEVLESNEEVMRLGLFDNQTDQPLKLGGQVYLYGAVMLYYRNGEWKAGTPIPSVGNEPLQEISWLPEDLVRQEITIEPLDRDELFCVMPFVPLESNLDVYIDHGHRRLRRSDHVRSRRFQYTLGTTGVIDGRQARLVPGENSRLTADTLQLPGDELLDSYLPESEIREQEALPRLRALADEWIAESGLPPEDRVGRALYLEQKLAASGLFHYSLQPQKRNPSLDPIEDFVSEHRAGHCEYFATALTLMLRSQGIPARLVIGFHCDEYNDLGKFFQVRQKHAHSWVEAYLEPEQIPEEMLHGKGFWRWPRTGGWLQLDPTPWTEIAGEQAAGPSLGQRFEQAANWVQSIWSNYVLEMDRQRQQETVYEPLARFSRQAIRDLRDPQWWRGLWQRMWTSVTSVWGSVWFWIALAAFVAFLAALGWLLWRLVRRFAGVWRRLAAHSHTTAQATRCSIEFYRRLETLLRRQGIVRQPGQTQQEFAAVAGQRLTEVTGQAALATAPREVVEAFYQVRFGGLPLDSTRAEAVEQALDRLAKCTDNLARRN